MSNIDRYIAYLAILSILLFMKNVNVNSVGGWFESSVKEKVLENIFMFSHIFLLVLFSDKKCSAGFVGFVPQMIFVLQKEEADKETGAATSY